AVQLDLARGHAPHALARLMRLSAFDEAAAVVAQEGIHMVLGPGHDDMMKQVAAEHPEILAEHPATWFVVALDRWMADDADGIQHWTWRMVAHAAGMHGAEAGKSRARLEDRISPVHLACARLWRAELGLEPL